MNGDKAQFLRKTMDKAQFSWDAMDGDKEEFLRSKMVKEQALLQTID